MTKCKTAENLYVEILNNHFNFVQHSRLHKDKVLDIFKFYKLDITLQSLNIALKQFNIDYNNSLREFGDSRKGVFIGLQLKPTAEVKPLTSVSMPVTVLNHGYSGKPLSKNSIVTWQTRIKKLNLLGLSEALENLDIDKIIDIVTTESQSLDTICTSITAILNLLYNQSFVDTVDTASTESTADIVDSLIALRRELKEKKTKKDVRTN